MTPAMFALAEAELVDDALPDILKIYNDTSYLWKFGSNSARKLLQRRVGGSKNLGHMLTRVTLTPYT